MTIDRPFRHRFLSILLVASAITAVTFGIQAQSAPAHDGVEQSMRQMNAALKAIGRGGINAENRDNALEQLSKFQAAVVAAKAQVPESAERIPEDKRALFVTEFRKQMIEVLKVAGDAEAAVLDGKYDVAQDLVRTKLGGLKKDGHEKFQRE